MKLLLENWRKCLTERVPASKIDTLVHNLHHNEEDFYEGNLIDRIYQYDVYEERDVSIRDITSPWIVDETMVDDYVKMGSKNIPHIVIDHDNVIIDGTHRVEAAKRLRNETIKAYVGIEHETPI